MWWIRNDDIREVLQPILRSWYQIEDEEFEHLMNELEQKGLIGGDHGPNPYLQLSFDTEKLNEIVQHEIVDKIKNGEKNHLEVENEEGEREGGADNG